MKILVVHNRYRSSSPSGEDRVVDQEHAAPGRCRPHRPAVRAVQRRHRHVLGGPQGARPGRGRLEPEVRPGHRAGARRVPARRRPRPQPVPALEPGRAHRLPASRRPDGGHPAQLPADLPSRDPLPGRGSLPGLRRAEGAATGRPARLLPRLVGRHPPDRHRDDHAAADLAVGALRVHLPLRRPAPGDGVDGVPARPLLRQAEPRPPGPARGARPTRSSSTPAASPRPRASTSSCGPGTDSSSAGRRRRCDWPSPGPARSRTHCGRGPAPARPSTSSDCSTARPAPHSSVGPGPPSPRRSGPSRSGSSSPRPWPPASRRSPPPTARSST